VILTALVQAALVGVLVQRNKRAEFPIFFWYNALAVVGGLTLLSADFLKASVAQYFYMYWIVNTVLMLLEFGVMYEIFVKALQPYTGLIDLGKMIFRWAGAFLLIAASLTAAATIDSKMAKCMAAVSLLERGLRLMQCGLLLLFFLFERRLGLAWRSYSISIGLGLGVSAAFGLSISYLHTRFVTWGFALDLLNFTQYLAIISFWAVCFYLREPERGNVLNSPSKLIFQRWNDVLVTSRFTAAASGGTGFGSLDSFLPNVEQTVERVLARKIVQ
jgi:energy-converting hydrogenase Eha subunit E